MGNMTRSEKAFRISAMHPAASNEGRISITFAA
jgi:hypothetical protein